MVGLACTVYPVSAGASTLSVMPVAPALRVPPPTRVAGAPRIGALKLNIGLAATLGASAADAGRAANPIATVMLSNAVVENLAFIAFPPVLQRVVAVKSRRLAVNG